MLGRVIRSCGLLWVCCAVLCSGWAGGLFAQTPPKVVGTAFVVSADGYLLTCAHSVKDAEKTDVAIGGKTYQASLVGMDEPHDLALVRIEAQGLTALPLADSETVEVGQEVWAFGFPLAPRLGESVKVARGTISGIENQGGAKLFQLDVLTNPGNSGGPLLNDEGEVVGIVRAKSVATLAETSVGFAVPINYAAKLLADHRVTPTKAATKTKWEGPALFKRVSPAVALLTSTMKTGQPQPVTFMIRPDGSYFTPSRHFSIKPPPGWKADLSGRRGLLAFTNDPTGRAGVVDIWAVGGAGNRELVAFSSPIAPGGGDLGLVAVAYRSNPEILPLYVSHMKAVFAAAVPHYKLVSDIRTTIKDQEVYEITFTFQLLVNNTPCTWRNLKAFFASGDDKYEITCAAQDSQFPQFEKTFSGVIGSFRIVKPPNKGNSGAP